MSGQIGDSYSVLQVPAFDAMGICERDSQPRLGTEGSDFLDSVFIPLPMHQGVSFHSLSFLPLLFVGEKVSEAQI